MQDQINRLQPEHVPDTLVMKFGGTSVGTAQSMAQAIEIVRQAQQEWPRLVVIVSALSTVTNTLLESADQAVRGNLQPSQEAEARLRMLHADIADTLVSDLQCREQVKEEIHEKHNSGISVESLCRQYSVSASTIWKVLKTKPQSQTTKHADVHSYVCINGHEFNSKLQPGEAMCPTCHTRDCDLGSLNRPVKEEPA
jgi:hypothetical protein